MLRFKTLFRNTSKITLSRSKFNSLPLNSLISSLTPPPLSSIRFSFQPLHYISPVFFTTNQQPSLKIPTSGDVLSEEEKASVIKGINLTYDGELLSLDTIIAISKAVNKFSDAECENLKNENKKLRRANQTNLKLYAQLCTECADNMTAATQNAETEVLKHLGVPGDVWFNSFKHYYMQGNTEILAQEQDVNTSAPISKPLVSRDGLRKVLLRTIELHQAELSNLPILIPLLKDPYLTDIVIHHRVADAIFEETGFDLEDVTLAIDKYNSQFDAEEKKIWNAYLQEIEGLKANIRKYFKYDN